MNASFLPQRHAVAEELTAWTVRGVFCSAPSLYWALLANGNFPAMLAGIATYVVLYAFITASPAYRAHPDRLQFRWALTIAANTRAVLAPVMVFGPDIWLGGLAMSLLTRADGTDLSMSTVPLSFGTTYAITLVQGAFVSGTMVLLAGLLWCGLRAWRAFRANDVAATAPSGNVGARWLSLNTRSKSRPVMRAQRTMCCSSKAGRTGASSKT